MITADIAEWAIIISGISFSVFGLAAACYGIYVAIKEKKEHKQ